MLRKIANIAQHWKAREHKSLTRVAIFAILTIFMQFSQKSQKSRVLVGDLSSSLHHLRFLRFSTKFAIFAFACKPGHKWAVCSLHIDYGFPDPMLNCLQLQRVLCGINQGSNCPQHQPVTADIMCVNHCSLDLQDLYHMSCFGPPVVWFPAGLCMLESLLWTPALILPCI